MYNKSQSGPYGGSPNFKGLLFDKKTTHMAQILQSLSYKVCSVPLSKFDTSGLFIVTLDASTIMGQTACCYNVTTSEIGLLFFFYFDTTITYIKFV